MKWLKVAASADTYEEFVAHRIRDIVGISIDGSGVLHRLPIDDLEKLYRICVLSVAEYKGGDIYSQSLDPKKEYDAYISR